VAQLPSPVFAWPISCRIEWRIAAIVLNTIMDAYLERLRRELEDAIAGRSADDLGKGPAGKWTAAEVLEHLYLTYYNNNRALAKCLEKGSPIATNPQLKSRIQAFAVINLGYFPEGRKSPAPALPKGMSAEDLRRDVFLELDRMDAGFSECDRKFGRGIRLFDHPVFGGLDSAQWRKFHWVHGRHHAKQIRERAGS
jgi:hypothetical protein